MCVARARGHCWREKSAADISYEFTSKHTHAKSQSDWKRKSTVQRRFEQISFVSLDALSSIFAIWWWRWIYSLTPIWKWLKIEKKVHTPNMHFFSANKVMNKGEKTYRKAVLEKKFHRKNKEKIVHVWVRASMGEREHKISEEDVRREFL